MTVWVSFALLVATMTIATWQAIELFQRVPLHAADPDALMNAGLRLDLTLGGLWLLVTLPSIGTLYGLRFCRTILAVCMGLGLLVVLVYRPPTGWDMLTLILAAVQALAAAILYVGPSRPFFRPGDDR